MNDGFSVREMGLAIAGALTSAVLYLSRAQEKRYAALVKRCGVLSRERDEARQRVSDLRVELEHMRALSCGRRGCDDRIPVKEGAQL